MDTKRLLLFMITARQKGYSDEDIQNFVLQRSIEGGKQQDGQSFSGQGENMAAGFSGPLNQILNLPQGNVPITQRFGQRSRYDVFSGGRNYGVDFATGENTPITAPQGEWEVVEARGGAKGRGYIGNKTNSGYGNTAMLRNTQTGEQIRLSHLNKIGVRPGQRISGGQVVALSGATGNVTGAHLDVEYRNNKGQLADILRTPYSKGLFNYQK